MNPERRQLLVGMLTALLLLKFFVIPWIDSQADARERLDVLTKRLDRSAGVVLNRSAITASLSGLERANAVDRPRFPESENIETYRLAAQQRVTGIVESGGLRVEVFDWILDGPSDSSGFGFIRGRVALRGDMRSQAMLLGALEGELPNMVVREVQYNFESGVVGPYDYKANMTLIADFYFRRKAMQ